jgi:hypothetical protein
MLPAARSFMRMHDLGAKSSLVGEDKIPGPRNLFPKASTRLGPDNGKRPPPSYHFRARDMSLPRTWSYPRQYTMYLVLR